MMQLAALTRVMLGHVKRLPSEVNGGVYLFEGGGWYLLWVGPELCQWSRVQHALVCVIGRDPRYSHSTCE